MRLYRSLPSRHQEYWEIVNKNETARSIDRETSNSDRKEPVAGETIEQLDVCHSSTKDDPCKDTIAKSESIPLEKFTPRVDSIANERTTNAKRIEKLSNKQEEEVPSSDAIKTKKNDRSAGNKTKIDEQDETTTGQEQSTPRISLIKPPRILSKFISPEIKSSPIKHGERKSNIPIFRRSSKEFEDIRSPQESPKRSLIPQRYSRIFNPTFDRVRPIRCFMFHIHLISRSGSNRSRNRLE